ncbi:hypothetical protein DNTS_011319 [Danionella cerebrum]|uniref:Uncharacterized protein n=1 Tax=Danionella cerebrum TaxID=2873325 RepID=A0A553MRW1_9TELE|nr:hypothetical protein DNTS_011319 [Danionella translucida]
MSWNMLPNFPAVIGTILSPKVRPVAGLGTHAQMIVDWRPCLQMDVMPSRGTGVQSWPVKHAVFTPSASANFTILPSRRNPIKNGKPMTIQTLGSTLALRLKRYLHEHSAFS